MGLRFLVGKDPEKNKTLSISGCAVQTGASMLIMPAGKGRANTSSKPAYMRTKAAVSMNPGGTIHVQTL